MAVISVCLTATSSPPTAPSPAAPHGRFRFRVNMSNFDTQETTLVRLSFSPAYAVKMKPPFPTTASGA